jgi:uncharacterized protein (DUF924 family)
VSFAGDPQAQALSLQALDRGWDVIARFGRFPHRNEALGRVSSAAELAFLQTPCSRF